MANIHVLVKRHGVNFAGVNYAKRKIKDDNNFLEFCKPYKKRKTGQRRRRY